MEAASRESEEPPEASRSARKRSAILEAATEAFLRNGYLGTSMDEVAAAAGVSKQTVYKQFGGKEALFKEIVLGTIDEVGEPFFSDLERLDDSREIEADLRELASRLITIVKDPRLLALRRLVIGEAGRFPELGRTYYERGPGRSSERLATMLRSIADAGVLRIEDAELAALQFNWLVLSIPLNQAMFSVDVDFSDSELERYAEGAVRVFLAAYGS